VGATVHSAVDRSGAAVSAWRGEGQIVTIEVDDTTLRIYDHRDHLIKTIPRTSRKEIRRHKAYGATTNQKTG
jgi:hypothetical protein